MAEQTITIGGKEFNVACQEGEEHFLQTAAKMLDAEAQVLLSQIGRMPENRMLLMAALMLADRTAGLEDQLRDARAQLSNREARLAEQENRPAPAPERIEVPVIPDDVTDTMAEIAARAEALADQVEERLKGG
ncbi:cell division protein ZapA [Alkalilacustris brevis]|uniref:cell division protein ZapA n=1 Tax=Alkalilacustris brevis TaxID=2026338 RepID=UPI000E0D32B5|nr:cell division protein ZapA [Alkalilacustris brevis]